MRKLTVGLLGSVMLCGSAQVSADVLGGSAHVTYWGSASEGSIRSGGNAIDIERDLGFDDEEFLVVSAALEHPVPFLPNIRLAYFSMDQVGTGTVAATFNRQVFTGQVRTNLDLSNLDVTLYYELLDNWVNLDLGVTGKVFDGNLDIRETRIGGARSTTDINAVLPMLYGEARFDLPFSGLSAGAQANAISYSGNTAYDASVYLGYRLVVLDIMAGYRQMHVDVEDIDDVDVNLDMSGPFLTLGVAI